MKRLVLFLGLLSLAGLLSCSKNGSGKITAPRLGGAGQWVSASGLDEGTFASVRAFAFNGKMNNMFALVENSGTRVWRSTDNGATWLRAGSGLRNLEIYCMASNGAYLFAGTSEGVFRSANDGASWELGEDAAPQGVDARPWHVTALDVQGTTVFAGGNKNSRNTSDGKFDVQQDGRVYRSTDNGQTWAQVFGGRGNSPGTGGQTNSKVTAIALSGTNLFLGTDRDGVFLHSTTDPDNAAWAPVSATLGNKRVTSLVVHGGALFAGTELYDICDQNGCVDFAGGVYRTLNNGTDWAPAGLETDADRDGVTFTAIGTELFARTSRDVFRYSGGTGWAKQTSPSATATVSALGANGTTLFAGTDGAGVFQSADNGANWTGVGKRNLNTLPVFALAASHDTLFAGTGNGLWRSTDLGATWTNLAVHDANEPFFKLTKVTAIKVTDRSIFAAGDYLFGFRSDLNGNDWHLLIGAGPPFFDPARAIIVSNGGDGVGSIAVHGHNVFIAGNDYLGQIWRSLDDGDHWANDWPPGAGAFVPVTGLSLFDSPVSTRVLVGLNRVGSAEYWQSIDNGTTWGPIPGLSTAGGYMRNVVVLPAGPDSTYFAGTEGLVWRTRDFVNWTAESDGLPGSSDLGLNILATSGPVFSGTTGLTSYLFAGTKNGVFRTAANTTGWEKFSSGLTAPNVHALVVIGNTVFAGTDAGVWKSALN